MNDGMNEFGDDPLTGAVIGACIEVHRQLGPGLTENIYESALCCELELRGIGYRRQVEIPVIYKGKSIGKGFIDLLIEDQIIIVELKACEGLNPIHRAQLICYLKLTNLNIGLLINFNVPVLKDGLKRVINTVNKSP
jgi:GxxExxY protein